MQEPKGFPYSMGNLLDLELPRSLERLMAVYATNAAMAYNGVWDELISIKYQTSPEIWYTLRDRHYVSKYEFI